MSNQQEHHHISNHPALQHQNSDVALQQEIEELKRALVEKEAQLLACMQETERQVELEDSIIAWQDKYERLYESHKRVQKVNQNLEDKLLKLVERGESKNAQLTSDVATLSVRLAQANYNISLLQREIERYKTDMGLAIQLLQCKPDKFVPQKINSKLPTDIQAKLRKNYMRVDTNSHSDSESSIGGGGGVGNGTTAASYSALPDRSDSPIENNKCPFQPTSMVYSMRSIDSCQLDHQQLNISPSVMVKFLEDELKSSETKHCDTCNCPNRDMTVLAILPKSYSVGTQTLSSNGDTTNSLCLRCNSNLNSPSRTNSPFMMKLVKSSDSVISETKSSVSDSTQNDKLFTPAKKDDIMVNPILGHHRLCERAKVITTGQLISTASPPPMSAPVTDTFSDILAVKGLSASSQSKPITAISNAKSAASSGAVTNASKAIEPVTMVPPPPVTVMAAKKNAIDEADLLLLHQSSDTLNDTLNDTDNEEAVNENTSLLGGGTASGTASGGNLLTPKSKSNSIASKLLLKSPEFMGGAKPKTPDSSAKKAVPNLSLKQCSDQNQYDVDKKSESLRGPGNGSTNSLWSRTSSRDGSKIFENFNRNLIKTIKAENPKMKGPRICALRIQNGSNNILLDNSLEENEATTPTQIVYTRRSRLLDEELDDEKEVTLALPEKTSVQTSVQTEPPPAVYEKASSACVSNNNIITGIDEEGATGRQTVATCTQPIKHRTSSSSIASDLDLRRQQLNRVAEWVQNNSKMNEMAKPLSNSVSDIDIDIMSFDGSATQCPVTPQLAAVQGLCSRNNNIKTLEESKQAAPTTLLTNKTFISQQLQPNNSTSCSASDFAQNNKNSINLYKYFELYAAHQEDEDEDDDDLLENEGESYDDYDEDNSEKNLNLDDENQIDLAQMEYNVKQFLLKQSEWSIHNKMSGTGGVGGASGGAEGGVSKTIPQRTETNL